MQRLTILLSLMLGLWAACAHAANYYVATNGSDNNPGTEAAPFLTLNKGISVLIAGDTLFIRAGTYDLGGNSTQIPTGTSWAMPITLKKYAGEAVTLTNGTLRVTDQAGYVVVEGESAQRMVLNGVGFDLVGSNHHHIRLKDLEIIHARVPAVDFGELINLHVHDLDAHFIYSHADDVLIDGGEWHDTCGSGNTKHQIQAKGPQQPYDPTRQPDRWIIRNARFYNAVTCSSGGGLAIFISAGAQDNLIYNNVFYAFPCTAITSHGARTKILNNTFWANRNQNLTGITDGSCSFQGDVRITGPDNVVGNNVFYQSNITYRIDLESDQAKATTVLFNNLNGFTTTGPHTDINPLFVDTATRNFALQAGSPAIDTGATLSEVQDDYMKVARPQGSGYDIGAYEYTSPKPTTPTNLRIIDMY